MRTVGATLAVALAYFLLGQLSLRFIQEPGTASIVWLPGGLAVASIWWLGWRGIVGSALGVALVVFAYWGALSPQVFLRALGAGMGFTLLWFLLRNLRFHSSFATLRDLIVFVASLVFAMGVASLWQTELSIYIGLIQRADFTQHFLTWLGGDLIGGMLHGTLLLLLRTNSFRPLYDLRTIVALIGLTVICSLGILVAYHLGQERDGLYTILAQLPLLIFVALRYEKVWSIFVLNGMLLTAVLIYVLPIGDSIFTQQGVYDLWIFLIISYLVTMTIAISQAQQKRFNALMEQSQRELQQAYEQLEAIIENSPTVAIQGYDLEGRVIFWNRASQQIYGYRPEEAIGKTLDQLIFTSEEMREYLVMLRQVAETGQPAPLKEWEIHTASGEKRYILSSLFPVWWRDEQIVICADIDITERKQLEAQLLQSQKMESIGRLAGGIAHDFNNLLTVIQGFAELAQSKLPTEHPAQTDLARIMQAVEKSASLTRQLLAFAGKAIVQPTPTDVHRVVHEMLPLFQRTLGEKVRLETDLQAERHTVKIDPSQLEQVLMNLVVNARDAMPNGGIITIMSRVQSPPTDCAPKIAQSEPMLCLCVQDTGVGISEEDLTHIFEPFFSTKGSRGYGLGLATVYGIINRFGGCIHVESQLGQGTTFHIYLPLCDEATQREVQSPVTNNASALRLLKVLLVEDEPAVRESLVTALTLMGYSVQSAGSVEEALTKSLEGVDILITDVVLPDRSGYELARRLAERLPELKCLFMTGYAEEQPQAEIPLKWKILAKPFRMEQLQNALRELNAS